MEPKKTSDVRVKKNEAAIIFDPKGAQLVIPNGKAGAPVPDHVYYAAALFNLMATDDKMLDKIIQKRIDKMDKEIREMKDANSN